MDLDRSGAQQGTLEPAASRHNSQSARRCRRKFLRFFPGGFSDPKYVDWERGYKWRAHQQWQDLLSRDTHSTLLKDKNFVEVAARAVRLESRTNLLFSF
jgi:hypothetical protein